jgi:uncharacterized protein YbjT (DUF2867 family)
VLLVTGATGTTGGAVLRALAERGVQARGLVREPSRAGDVSDLGAEPAIGDLGDPGSLRPALDGVERAYLVSPAGPQQAEYEQAFLEAAREAGVAHVVKLSVLGAAEDAPVRFARGHARVERALRDSGLAWTVLRPNGYFQNALAWTRGLRDGRFHAPVPDAAYSAVDARDVGEAAALALTTDGHAERAHELTGPEALSIRAQAARLLGEEVAVEEVPVADLRAALVAGGVPAWNAEGLAELLEHYAAGGAAEVSGDLEALLGRPPRTLDDFARDHEEAFT